MEIKKNTKVKVQYRPELGAGSVLQVAEASGGEYNVDVVFEKDGKRFLETFPRRLVKPVADIFQRYQNNRKSRSYDLSLFKEFAFESMQMLYQAILYGVKFQPPIILYNTS